MSDALPPLNTGDAVLDWAAGAGEDLKYAPRVARHVAEYLAKCVCYYEAMDKLPGQTAQRILENARIREVLDQQDHSGAYSSAPGAAGTFEMGWARLAFILKVAARPNDPPRMRVEWLHPNAVKQMLKERGE